MKSFELESGEHQRRVYHPSKWTLLKFCLLYFVAVGLPARFFFKYTVPSVVWQVFLVWCSLWSVWILWHIVKRQLESYIVTNRRLVVIKYKTPFSHTVDETPLEKVLNVGLVRHGVAETLLGLGTVLVRVVGMEDPMHLRHLRDAPGVVRYLWQESARIKEEKNLQTEVIFDRHKQIEV